MQLKTTDPAERDGWTRILPEFNTFLGLPKGSPSSECDVQFEFTPEAVLSV
jgi:hypothetical protein